MRSTRTLGLTLLLGLVLITGVLAVVRRPGEEGVPPVPTTTGSVELLVARPFVVEQPYVHAWRAERPLVSKGHLLVLAVDPAFVFPHQVKEPVLYVGTQTAERINVGYESGRIVALVPGDLDLTTAPIFFGEPALPEEVDAAEIERQVALAVGDGISPPAAPGVAAVLGEPLHAFDHDHLRRLAADLIERYSPQEVDLINGLRAPRIDGR